MTELNITEAKSLSLVEDFINDIQNYVDENIREGNAMTAADIYEGFKSKGICGLAKDDFIKGFRAGVKSNRIQGIEGAKGAGYRRIGDTLKSKNTDDSLELFEPYIDGIQSFIDKNIQGEVKMTAAVIFDKFSRTTKVNISSDDFVKLFRLAIREGRIKGLESAYRFGYKRASAISETESVTSDNTDNEEEKTGHDNCEIIIDERRRLVGFDRFNWVLQVRRDTGTWANEAFIPKVMSGIKCLASRLMEDELKGLGKIELKDFVSKVTEAENHLVELLTKILVQKKDPEKEEA